MGRASTKQNKNIYQLSREELGLSREKASDLLVTVPPERIEKIESEKSLPHPDEVMTICKNRDHCCGVLRFISPFIIHNNFVFICI